MMIRQGIADLALAALAAAVLVFAASYTKAADILPFETATAEMARAPLERVYDGTVEAVNQATMSAQTAGRIAEVFFDSGKHLSLAEVHELAKAQHSSVGFATVYRTMKLLAESGLAHEHKFAEGNVRYEPAGDHHDHLICVRCEKIVEFEEPRIEALQEETAKRLGFRFTGHKMELYGVCRRCRASDRATG